MSIRNNMVYGLTIAGALAGCARAIDEQGAAPFADNAELHMDQRVTVTGQIDEVRGEQTFVLRNDDLTAGEPLLVIATQPAREITMGRAMVARGEWIEIYGTIRRLNPNMEQAYNFTLDPDLAVRYDNRPVLVTGWIAEPSANRTTASR